MMSVRKINELIDEVVSSLMAIIELKWPDDNMYYDAYGDYDIRNGKEAVGDMYLDTEELEEEIMEHAGAIGTIDSVLERLEASVQEAKQSKKVGKPGPVVSEIIADEEIQKKSPIDIMEYDLSLYSTDCCCYEELSKKYERFIQPNCVGHEILKQPDKTEKEVRQIFRKLSRNLMKLADVCNEYAETYLDSVDEYNVANDEVLRIGEIFERARNSRYHLFRPEEIITTINAFRDEINNEVNSHN